jgi:hypothetical protein
LTICGDHLVSIRECDCFLNTPTVKEELAWCQIELANIKAGIFSMYSQDYIEGAISALKLARGSK